MTRPSAHAASHAMYRGAALFACGVVLTAACVHVASPARTASSAVDTTPSSSPLSEEIVVRTNAERKNLGLSTLVRNTSLMKAAQLHANQMAALNTMAHELPGASYPSPRSRLDAVGYRMRAFGENVAEGYPSAAAVVAGWMTSPGHRANIVSTHFIEIGAGVATAKNGRPFYAQVFAIPR